MEDEPITSKHTAIRGAHAIRVTAGALLATAVALWLPLPGGSGSTARAEEEQRKIEQVRAYNRMVAEKLDRSMRADTTDPRGSQ